MSLPQKRPAPTDPGPSRKKPKATLPPTAPTLAEFLNNLLQKLLKGQLSTSGILQKSRFWLSETNQHFEDEPALAEYKLLVATVAAALKNIGKSFVNF